METQSNRLLYLLKKFENGEATIGELDELDRWYDSFEQEEKYTTGLSELQQQMASGHLFSRIMARLTSKKARPVRLAWYRIAAAAVLLLTLGIGFYFYSSRQDSYANDIAPGKNGATLTLANGKKIHLGDALSGKLAEESGVTISKAANGQLTYILSKGSVDLSQISKKNTLTTARGETYNIVLPDGSQVSLNAQSSLTYPVSFANTANRTVQLTGEGYFEVAKDKKHPFIVETAGQQLEVLGTHFNINSYGNEGLTKTTLIEGSVKIAGKSGGEGLLKPGQQASLTSDGRLKIGEVDTELAIAWKNNKFMFESQQIRDIMRMVERWYDAKVVYEGEVPSDRFSGTVSRFGNVSQVLRMLEKSGGVHFRISDEEGAEKTIYVSK